MSNYLNTKGMLIGNYLLGSLSPKDQIKLIQKGDLKRLSIFMEKFTLDETALAEVIKHSLWSVFCKEFSKTTHKVSLTSDEFQSFYSYCEEHEPDSLKLFVEKDLFTKELQQFSAQQGFWDILIIQLKKFSWNFELTKEEFKNFYAYGIENNMNSLRIFVGKDLFTSDLQKVAAQQGFWNVLTMQLKYGTWSFELTKEEFKSFYSYCEEHEPYSLKLFVEKNLLTADLQKVAAQNGYWDILIMQLRHSSWDVELTKEEFQSFYSYSEEHEQDSLKIFVKKNLFTKDLQEIAAELGYWDILTMQLRHSSWDVDLTKEEFQSFYSYSEEHEQNLLKVFVQKNLFTSDLQEIAVQMKYNLIIYEALVSEKLSVKIGNKQLVNLDKKIIKLYLEQSPIAEEEIQTAIENKNFLLLKYALKYSKEKIMITDRKFFWEFFRTTEYTSKSIEYSPQIEAGIFLPENENLIETYSENKFRYEENEKFFLNSTELYPDLIWKYAQNFGCELSLNQRLAIYKNTDGKCDNILSQSEYLYHIRVPEVLRTGNKLDTVRGFSKEDLDKLSGIYEDIFDLNALDLAELAVLAIHTEMTDADYKTVWKWVDNMDNSCGSVLPIYSSDEECHKIWKKIINILWHPKYYSKSRLRFNDISKLLPEYGLKTVPYIDKYKWDGIYWDGCFDMLKYLNLAYIVHD